MRVLGLLGARLLLLLALVAAFTAAAVLLLAAGGIHGWPDRPALVVAGLAVLWGAGTRINGAVDEIASAWGSLVCLLDDADR